jgi:choline kinase
MTKALILAAGQGTRLRPLTDNLPKCLVPFCGKSLLHRQIETLNACGVGEIYVATGFCSQEIEVLGYPTFHNPKFDSTNMVESMIAARSLFEGGDDLIVAYGDIIYEQKNLKQMLECEEAVSLMIDKNWEALWSLRFEDPLDDAETLKMDSDGYVVELGNKPEVVSEIEGQYTGLIKIRGDKLLDILAFYDSIRSSSPMSTRELDNMYMTTFLQMIIDSGTRIKAVEVSNGWLEIDSVQDLEYYEKMAEDGSLDSFYRMNQD